MNISKDFPGAGGNVSETEKILSLIDLGQAAEAIDLIKALLQGAQREVLAAPFAVAGLAFNGQAEAVIALIEALPLDAQRDVFAAPFAVKALERNGQAEAVKRTRAGWERNSPAPAGAAPAP